MISQILRDNDTLLPYLYESAVTHGETRLSRTKRPQEVLEVCLKSLNNVSIVIDGLDECQPEEKKKIANWFKDFIDKSSSDGFVAARCLFLAQSDQETVKLFKSLPSVNIEATDLANDIQTFCRKEGDNIKEKFDLTDTDTTVLVQ